MLLKIISAMLILVEFSCLVVLPLTGGILQQQYMTTIYIGTPPQAFTVQIDTGSAKLGINCASCATCQNGPHPPFDLSLSSTASRLTCVPMNLLKNDQYPFCTNCELGVYSSELCTYRSDYYDGSWISGEVIIDQLSIDGSGSNSVQKKIGCINNRSSEFAIDNSIDGIWGIGRSGTTSNE